MLSVRGIKEKGEKEGKRGGVQTWQCSPAAGCSPTSHPQQGLMCLFIFWGETHGFGDRSVLSGHFSSNYIFSLGEQLTVGRSFFPLGLSVTREEKGVKGEDLGRFYCATWHLQEGDRPSCSVAWGQLCFECSCILSTIFIFQNNNNKIILQENKLLLPLLPPKHISGRSFQMRIFQFW